MKTGIIYLAVKVDHSEADDNRNMPTAEAIGQALEAEIDRLDLEVMPSGRPPYVVHTYSLSVLSYGTKIAELMTKLKP